MLGVGGVRDRVRVVSVSGGFGLNGLGFGSDGFGLGRLGFGRVRFGWIGLGFG